MPFKSRRHGGPCVPGPSAVLLIFMWYFCCLVWIGAEARLERHSYVAYRIPHQCSLHMKEAVSCPSETPMCCTASSAVRCCPLTNSCGNCTEDIVGYEMPRSSVIIGSFSLSILVLLGSIIMSGVGRHLAWVLERRRIIRKYRSQLLLRRAEAREFQKELAETEDRDIDDAVACVICCARHMDVALIPCGHVCCCRFCARRLTECPVCRGAVTRRFDLPQYYAKQLLNATAGTAAGGDEQDHAMAQMPTGALREERGSSAVGEEKKEEDGAAARTPTPLSTPTAVSRAAVGMGLRPSTACQLPDSCTDRKAASATPPTCLPSFEVQPSSPGISIRRTSSGPTRFFSPFRSDYVRLCNAEDDDDGEATRVGKDRDDGGSGHEAV